MSCALLCITVDAHFMCAQATAADVTPKSLKRLLHNRLAAVVVWSQHSGYLRLLAFVA